MSCSTMSLPQQPIDSALLATLPSELHLLILEHAASTSVATALSLSLVSSWVHTLAQPFLYHTVVLSNSRALSSFHTTMSNKPSSFASTHVKHLGIFAPGPVETIDKVLGLCQGVDSLACGFSLPAYKELQGPAPLKSLCPTPSVKEQHLLSLSCRDGWDVSLVSPSVTHLRVHITSPQRPWFAAPGAGANTTLESSTWDLSYLPHLTHLGIVWKPAKSQNVEDVLVPLTRLLGSSNSNDEQDSQIQVILIQILGTRAAQDKAVKCLNESVVSQGGRALRVVAEAAPLSAVSQWENGVRCKEGRGVWEGAEAVVRERERAALVKV